MPNESIICTTSGRDQSMFSQRVDMRKTLGGCFDCRFEPTSDEIAKGYTCMCKKECVAYNQYKERPIDALRYKQEGYNNG